MRVAQITGALVRLNAAGDILNDSLKLLRLPVPYIAHTMPKAIADRCSALLGVFLIDHFAHIEHGEVVAGIRGKIDNRATGRLTKPIGV